MPRSRDVRICACGSAFACASPEFPAFASEDSGQLGPVGPLEAVLARRAASAARTLRDGGSDRDQTRAERSLLRCLTLLRRLRQQRPVGLPPEVSAAFDEAADFDLDFEPAISEVSPVVRGTWITVAQVVERVVEGWTWKDILRDYPELTEDDIRACLTYSADHPRGARGKPVA